MENLSLSLPNKSFREHGFGGKAVYDDVVGGPAKFGVPILSPRVEDYTEIFEGFHASRGPSIPILDLPVVVDEAADLLFDVQSSKFDYSEVFGGFNDLDFAVSYEELFKQTNDGGDSSFETWTPAQSGSLSDESDPSACSEKNQSLSSGDLPPLFDGTKQFNILYHKANPKGKEDMLNGMTHVTQSDAVPEYSSTLNETPPAEQMEDEKLHLHLNLNTDFGGKLIEEKRFRKTMSQPPNGGFGVQEYANELRPSSRHDKASPSRKAFISVSDISLITQPSHLPPPCRPPPTFSDISKLKASKSYAFERMEADSSLAYFDVEIDVRSSAAAMKDAVEKTQAQLRSAKELMECRKVGLQSRAKQLLETVIEHKGEKTSKCDRFNNFQDEEVQSTCEREGNEMEPDAAERMKKVRNATQVVSGVTEAVKSALNDHGKEHTSSRGSHKTEGSVVWSEVTQFYEVVETKKLKDEKTLAQQSKSHDCGQKGKGTAELLARQEYTRRIKAASMDPEQEETGEQFDVLKGAKGSNRQEEHQEKANVVQKVCECQEKEKKTGMTLLLGETEKILYELDKCEDDEILTKEQLKENEMVSEWNLMGVNERVEYEKIVNEAHDSKENGREIKESFGNKEYEIEFKEDVDLVENRGKLKEALWLGTKEKQEKEFCELEEIEKKQDKTREIGENKKKLVAALESEGKTKWSKEVIEQEENVNRLKVDLKQQENNKEQKGSCEAEQNEESSEDNPEQEENAKKQEKAYDGWESETRLTDDCESEKNEKRLKEAWEQEENGKKLQEVDESDDTDKRVELHFKEKDTKDRSKEASEREDYENRIRDDINCEGFCRQDSVHVQNKGVEHERKFRDVLPAQKFTSQIPGQKEMNLNEKLTLEEKEKDERLKRERNLENDRLRRIEEEREREREREKDRMAVDTATREACESAFSEGRGRAEWAAVERAAAEVRLKALAEARERLEKVSAEARERLTAEKASTEAKRKVERAAVDRATAEARERAFEKAKKASFEAREQVERSVADKFSAYSRNKGLRQTSSSSDLQYQNVGSYHDLKYSHSSVHGGLEGESAQRCKARLERHQRTSARAAKALAEKNMRDLLAHKEQVERNRFAEALDTEVKRWSSGKEGNLRALLSTLQYILEPDSGWQPIPLTDVITDVAVKKAYRKATLCVHPDKLQQRGSSIQQKYICEKVFDLLKEAWNKFNSEER